MNETTTSEIPRGLPERLPEGEHILWQGAPDWWSLSRRTFYVGTVGFYFAALIAVRIGVGLSNGESLTGTVSDAMAALPLGLATMAILGFMAWCVARTTVYTITNQRIVMRIGAAISKDVNLPYTVVTSAGLRTYADETGDIPLTLNGDGKVAYLNLWPHARPWRLARPEPMLRCVPDAAKVAAILSSALSAQLSDGKVASGDVRGKLRVVSSDTRNMAAA